MFFFSFDSKFLLLLAICSYLILPFHRSDAFQVRKRRGGTSSLLEPISFHYLHVFKKVIQAGKYSDDDNDNLWSRQDRFAQSNKIIDVEAEEVNSDSSSLTKKVSDSNEVQMKGSGFKRTIEGVTNLAKGVVSGISSIFNKKISSRSLTREEAVQKEIEKSIDEILEGSSSGIFPSIAKSLMRSMINSVARSASPPTSPLRRFENQGNSMDEFFLSTFSDLFSSSLSSQNNIALIQNVVTSFLQGEPTLMANLGGSSVESSPPVSQSVSTVNINGQSSTQISVQYNVQGTRASASVLTRAVISDGQVSLQNIIIDFDNGQRRDFSAYQIKASLQKKDISSKIIEAEEDDLMKRRWK